MTAINEIAAIDFHGNALLAQKGETPATTLVAMKPLVEGMGLDWASQFTKIKRHQILSGGVVEITIPSLGGAQTMTALPLEMLPGWMMLVHPKKVPDPATRAKIVQYQKEAFGVLFKAFFAAEETAKAPAPNMQESVKALIADLVAQAVDIQCARLVESMRPSVEMMEKIVAGFDPGIRHVRDYRPMIEFLIEEQVPKVAKRQALATRCGDQFWKYCVRTDQQTSVKFSNEVKPRRIFKEETVREWLAVEGRAVIREHRNFVEKQLRLQLTVVQGDKAGE